MVYGSFKSSVKKVENGFTPKSIKHHLDRHVIGQEDAKMELALTLFSHHYNYKESDSENEKNEGPLMLVGPTGLG